MRSLSELDRKDLLTRISMVRSKINENEFNDFIKLFKNLVDVIAYVEYREPLKSKHSYEYNEKFSCSQLWQRMFISSDGDVIVCCVDSEKDYIVGNIKESSIEEIWNNEKYRNIRKLHKDGKYNQVDICSKCDLTQKKESGSF